MHCWEMNEWGKEAMTLKKNARVYSYASPQANTLGTSVNRREKKTRGVSKGVSRGVFQMRPPISLSEMVFGRHGCHQTVAKATQKLHGQQFPLPHQFL